MPPPPPPNTLCQLIVFFFLKRKKIQPICHSGLLSHIQASPLTPGPEEIGGRSGSKVRSGSRSGRAMRGTPFCVNESRVCTATPRTGGEITAQNLLYPAPQSGITWLQPLRYSLVGNVVVGEIWSHFLGAAGTFSWHSFSTANCRCPYCLWSAHVILVGAESRKGERDV